LETNRKSEYYQTETVTDAVLLIYLLIFLGIYFDIRYLFTDTVVTGGDTASWYGVARHMLDELLPNGRLSGWDMGNFCGYPNFSFYFIPPFLMAVAPAYFLGLPLTVTLKVAIMVGIFMLPLTTYFGLRVMKYRFPVPIMGAAASFLILFNESYTMFGGNALSTFAGEFCYMFAFALFPWFAGLLYQGVETGKGAVKTGVLLGIIGLSHLFVFIPAVLLAVYWYLARGKVPYIWKVAWVGFGIMAFWILPVLAYRYPYTTPVYIIWQDFISWHHALSGLGLILLMAGPGMALFCLRDQAQTGELPKHDFSLCPSRRLLSLPKIMIIFASVLAFVGFYFLCTYLVLGQDMWHRGISVPNLSLSPIGKEAASALLNLIIPISLFLSFPVVCLWIWAGKKKHRFEKLCKLTGFLCFMTVLGVLMGELYHVILDPIKDEGTRALFLGKSLKIPICVFLLGIAGWLLFFSETGKRAIQHMISHPGPRVFGMYAGLIFGCVMTYFGAHFLNIPDIRFLPPILFALILLFFADTCGGFFASYSLKIRISGAVGFCFLCALWVILGAVQPDDWYRYNNKGYEGTPGYREYIQINDYLRNYENTDPLNAPRVGYEKCDEYGLYGGDRAFESLPAFSGRQTMEGIHYASSPASKFMAFFQTEYSRDIKTPKAHILSRMNPDALPVHLGLYNISQLILSTAEAKRVFADSPLFKREADFGQLSVYRYLECDGKYVDVPEIRPVLYTPEKWIEAFYQWYIRPELNGVLLIPEKFIENEADKAVFFSKTDDVLHLEDFRKDRLNREKLEIDTHLEHLKIRFTTNKVGLPHLVKVSYFPNWQVERGANGVYPVSPHLMMVIPREKEVILTYGMTSRDKIGWSITGFTLISLLVWLIFCAVKKMNSVFAERISAFAMPIRGFFQYLFLPVEKSLTFLRPRVIVPVFLAAFLFMAGGAVERNQPVRAYIQGARYYEMGVRQISAGHQEEGEKYFGKAIAGMEKFLRNRREFDQIDIVLSMFSVSMCYENLGQNHKAEEWYRQVIAEYPHSRYVGEAYWKLALLRKYERDGNLKLGLEKLKKSHEASGLSLLRKAIRQTGEMREYLEKAVETDPHSQWAKNARKEVRRDRQYMEDFKSAVFAVTTAEDIIEFFSPVRENNTGTLTGLYLDAKSGWSDTGLRVEKEQYLDFECSGIWAAAPESVRDVWPDAGPGGHAGHPAEKIFRHLDSEKELPGIPFAALLGKVGKTIFLIGDKEKVIMPESGRLFLVINDCPPHRHDNRGGLRISIQGQQRN